MKYFKFIILYIILFITSSQIDAQQSSNIPFFLHTVEIGNLACPDDIGQNFAALPLCCDLGHELAGAGRLIIHLNTGVFLLETLNYPADKRFLHGRINDEFLASCGWRCRFLIVAAATCKQDTAQHDDC